MLLFSVKRKKTHAEEKRRVGMSRSGDIDNNGRIGRVEDITIGHWN